jgi:hypothetical protein
VDGAHTAVADATGLAADGFVTPVGRAQITFGGLNSKLTTAIGNPGYFRKGISGNCETSHTTTPELWYDALLAGEFSETASANGATGGSTGRSAPAFGGLPSGGLLIVDATT